jgi:ammonia/methane monooxygenase subunit B
MTMIVTNNGDILVCLGEFNIVGVCFLDLEVYEDEIVYPDDLLVEEGLIVSDNSLLVLGEICIIEVIVFDAAWEVYCLVDLIYDLDSCFVGLLFFWDENGLC